MKKLLLLLFVCCLGLQVLAQNTQSTITIKGTIVDSAKNEALGYVTVAVQNAATKAPVKSMLAKDNGSFELVVSAGVKYRLALVFVGYADKIVPVTGEVVTIDLGKMLLAPSTKQLNEVSINAVKPMMKQEIDRISYDVAADPETPVLTALDMMRKVPLVSVDGSDNILLKGDGNYKILINGKESALMAKNPSDVLKAMPATNIDKIEIITTPPAKYDAEGLSGIINIITKRNVDQGYNVGLNTRFNTVFGAGYNLNGTVKEGKLGVSFFGGFGSNGTLTNDNGSTEYIYSPGTKNIH